MIPGNEEVESEIVLVRERAEARARASRLSWTTLVLATVAAAAIAFGPCLPGAEAVFGRASPRETAPIALLAWLTHAAATFAHHRRDSGRGVGRALDRAAFLVRHGASAALVFASGSAASPFWLVGMGESFVRHAAPRDAERWRRGGLVGTHLVVAIAFAVTTRYADAAFAILVLVATVEAGTLTSKVVARAARVEAERDLALRSLRDAMVRKDRERMARELHDGLGADIMALVLRLDRESRKNADPTASELASRARDLMDELRGVVWSLRNQQGTLADLGKLVDANVRSLRGRVAYERRTPLEHSRLRVGPAAALAALREARRLVLETAAIPGTTRVVLTLSVDRDLVLAVDGDGRSTERPPPRTISLEEPADSARG
ncbi:MAG: histidine kinase [Polyangiaceae bacterium]